ncbi:hypothetical protein C7212DRAFT_184054 [Tuber magnatum]|uniref:Uncharacterized protein n=1 Tax=Tuber magnatum TaxID=42249 RepID=A0A317SX86_9PEZI|nr:hypothetical protein C7212DRAFT_184054 [Tuber magnatum]
MATRHLPIRDLHHTNATMLPDNPILAPPPDDTPAAATTASVAPTSIPPSVGSPSTTVLITPERPITNIPPASLAPAVSFTRPPATDPPISSPLAPHQGNPWDLETSYPGNGARFTSIPITPPRVPAQSNTRRLPRGGVGQTSLTPGRESSPSRLSTISALAGSQLSRVASVRHTRSHSTPMGLTGDNRGKHQHQQHQQHQQQRNTPGLFSSIFTPSTRQNPPERQDPPLSSMRAVTSSASALASAVGTPKSGNKGFFGFAFGSSNQPNSPPSSRSSTRALSPDRDTCLVDEFAGISFRELLKSYTVEPLGTPETPEEALKRTPEGRLGELAETAGDLLERVYEAYKARTNALSDVMDQQADDQDLLEESGTKTAEYKLQLERLATEERAAREEQQLRLAAYEKRIRGLEDELHRERAKAQDFEQRAAMANRKKLTSAASDSGFESDADSLFSIRERDRMASPVGSFLDASIDETSSTTSTSTITTSTASAAPLKCDSCAKSLHPVSSASSIASTRNPTPLSQAWPPSNSTGNNNNPTSKWGFAAALRGNRQTGVWGGSDAEIVRQENRMLRARVGELEAVVDDVLEVVAGRGVF